MIYNETVPVTIETSSQSETFSSVAPTGGYYPAYVLRGGARRKTGKGKSRKRAVKSKKKSGGRKTRPRSARVSTRRARK
jgi:hypothetical protein